MNYRSAIQRFRRFSGIDRPIAYTIAGKGLYAVANFVTVILIAQRLTKIEQGYFYTFASVLGLQVFFDLGLSYVILQFTSHEKVKLEWTRLETLDGDETAKSRLSSLLRLALKYYGAVALLVALVITPVGVLFFQHNSAAHEAINWRLPWLWLGFATACSVIMSPLYALIEGTGNVADIALMRAAQSLMTSFGLWIGLLSGGRLFATSLSATMGFATGFLWVALRYRHFLTDLFRSFDPSHVIGWWDDIFPFQWKIALSWLSGYLIFQLFSPVLFAFQGPTIAGQMGMSLTVASGIAALALAWVSTKAAPFGSLVARKDYATLDKIFYPCLKQSLLALISMYLVFWGGVRILLGMHHSIAMRFLAPGPLGLFLAAMTINHVVAAMAVYLRAHKQEPFIWVSLAMGCLTSIIGYVGARYSNVDTVIAGYLLVNMLVGLGWGTRIFRKMKRLWHEEERICV